MSTSYSTDQILASAGGSAFAEGAEFWAKCTKVEAKLSEANPSKPESGGKAFLQVTWQVLDGDYEGLEAVNTYWLGINKRQSGDPSAKSLLRLLNDCKTVGHPFPDHAFKEKPDKADAMAIGKIVAGFFNANVTPRFRLKAIRETIREQDGQGNWGPAHDDEGNVRKRTIFAVIPPPPSNQQAQSLLGQQTTAPASVSNVTSPAAETPPADDAMNLV